MNDTARVACVNRTLGMLGQEPVTDLSDASLAQSTAAVKVLRHLDAARDLVLARHGWTCALEYKTLTPAVLPKYQNWRYPTVYLLPGEALRVWGIGGAMASGREIQCWGPRWEIGTTEANGSAQLIIRASADPGTWNGQPAPGGWAPWNRDDADWPTWGKNGDTDPMTTGSLNVVYIRRASWQALDQHVLDAVAGEAAKRACYNVTGDAILANAMAKAAENAAILAVSVDLTGEGGQPPPAPSIPMTLRAYSRF